jgi:hypothetical protein
LHAALHEPPSVQAAAILISELAAPAVSVVQLLDRNENRKFSDAGKLLVLRKGCAAELHLTM